MQQFYYLIIIAYAAAANIAAVSLTVYDKYAARKKHRRISEKNLLIAAALSGCVLMYATMCIIHHKTRHKKFMIGIPAIFIAEVAVAAVIYFVLVNVSG